MNRLAQLEADKKALQEEISHLRLAHQSAINHLEERLAIEKRYQESQNRFRTIFEHSTFGNKIITPDLQIIQVNAALQAMLGYSEQELLGTRVLEYTHADHVKPWDELQKHLWAKQIPSFAIETVLIRKDGSTLWCHVTSILIPEGNNSLGYTIVEDISERKAVEEKLKKLYESQEIVIHTVAHDLKNPIHTIKSVSNYLKRNVEKLQEVSAQKYTQSLTFIDMIEGSCEKAYSIIKDLLLIGQIELDKLTFKKESIDLKRFIEPLLIPFRLEAQKKEIEINFHFPSEPVYAHINREKFTRVVENLLSNAIKFTKVEGEVNVSLLEESQKVILQVSDNGIGIPIPLQNSVFHKFTKANRQGTEGEATTGLGLYIVKQIVELHRGKIWLKSIENQGTDFFVELT